MGRREKQAYCLLFTESEESSVLTRLKLLESLRTGIELAEADLRIRGPGEIFGLRQHGTFPVKIANIFDVLLVSQTKEAAKKVLKDDPELAENPYLRETLGRSTITTIVPD